MSRSSFFSLAAAGRHLLPLLLGACAGAAAPEPADGIPLPSAVIDLDGLTATADAVFVGTVRRVESRVSRGEGDIPGMPFTFVTLDVEEGVGVSDASVTLRFIGGSWPDGRRLLVSELPELREGARYLVHAKDNGESGCPLVRCASGLFHLDGDLVRGVDHRTMWRLADGGLGLAGEDPKVSPEAGAVSLRPGELMELSREAIRSVRPARAAALRSLDPQVPFTFTYSGGDVPVDAAPAR